MSTKRTARPTDVIPLEQAATLAGVFAARIRRSPRALAYRQFDETRQGWTDISWSQAGRQAARWRQALAAEGLKAGERVAVMLHNCLDWVLFDLAAQSLGLVTVPLYINDRPDNIAYILEHADVRLLFMGDGEQWQALRQIAPLLAGLKRVVSQGAVDTGDGGFRPVPLAQWLPAEGGELAVDEVDPDALATIVYTSGTTGRPKGVMLSHRNILWNDHAGIDCIPVYPDDLFLSFLPLSHTLERTIGFYLPIVTGTGVAFCRSIHQLGEDLQQIRPTILISVPRIFERIYGKLQDKLDKGPALARLLFRKAVDIGWRRFQRAQGRAGWSPDQLLWPLLDRLVAAKVRDRLGGRLRFSVCGGAALSPEVARLFIGLGLPIVQGYGLTETSPVISVNTLEDNIPASVGLPMAGVEIAVGEQDELRVRSPSVMLGYWKDPEATARTIDSDGWLVTGDKVRIEADHIFITGRIKEIIVLANGEKVPPGDMEMAITLDPLFKQALLIGEGRPYLSALVVADEEALKVQLANLGLPPDAGDGEPRLQKMLLERIGRQLHDFPGYARIMHVALVREPWTVDNGFMTPTMKLRRSRILAHHADDVVRLYQGHT